MVDREWYARRGRMLAKEWRTCNKQRLAVLRRARYAADPAAKDKAREKMASYRRHQKEKNLAAFKAGRHRDYLRHRERLGIPPPRVPVGPEERRRRKAERKKRPQERMRKNLSRRMRELLRSRGACTSKLLGCSGVFLRGYISSLFKPGMSWENYGAWHIDHIRSCASFDLTDSAQQRECFHFSNLQPLWAVENIKKGDKWAA
jgi:hypothetical protein